MFICVLKCISYLRVYASFYRGAPIAAWICPRTDSDVAEAILAALKLDINECLQSGTTIVAHVVCGPSDWPAASPKLQRLQLVESVQAGNFVRFGKCRIVENCVAEIVHGSAKT